MKRFSVVLAFVLASACACVGVQGQENAPPSRSTSKPSTGEKNAAKQNSAKPISPAEELQRAISSAGNDRAVLVRNLKAYLEKYPDAPERPRIYRALVEACMQFKDDACATDYAERIVALTPDDTSMTLLVVQMLERSGDLAGLRRAVTYVTRVNDSLKATPVNEKSPRVSLEEWEAQKKRDESALLALRGRLEGRLNDSIAARRDYEESYALEANATAALRLGELDELAKDYEGAATQYARAFALSDAPGKPAQRREIREKLGNAWRLAHGSDAGLGDFLLKTIDRVAAAGVPLRPLRNDGVKDPYEFVLRRAPEGTRYPFAALKGKTLVINFWATWCRPCHALEPIYEKLAARNADNPDLVFLAANCDEDESLVGPYLGQRQTRTTEVFADRLDEFFGVESFPTLLILDSSGKIAFRANGFDPETIEADLAAAIRRAATDGTGKSKSSAGVSESSSR